MRSSSRYGRRTGWRAVFDPEAWARMLLVVTVWVVFLSALACAVALVRDTTGHDWYATGKLARTKLMIGIGFDDNALTEYRDWRGEVEALTRAEMLANGDAWVARGHLLRTARKAAELGACCGLGAALPWFWLIGRQHRRQRPIPAPLPPVGPAESQARGVAEPEPAGARESGKGAGNTGTRRKRRKRNYERWI